MTEALYDQTQEVRGETAGEDGARVRKRRGSERRREALARVAKDALRGAFRYVETYRAGRGAE